MLRTLLTAVAAVGACWIAYRLERLMADFAALNVKLDQVAGLVANLKAEWATLKEQLANDTADQAAVDAAAARVDAIIGDLGTVDLIPDVPAEPAAGGETPAEPEQPAL